MRYLPHSVASLPFPLDAQRARMLADSLTHSREIGEVFLRVHEYLLDSQVMPLCGLLHGEAAVKAEDAWESAHNEFLLALGKGSSLGAGPDPRLGELVLDEDAHRRIREYLVEALRGGDERRTFTILVALLKAIDEDCSEELITAFTHAMTSATGAYVLRATRPFPRPRRAFNTDGVDLHAEAPTSGVRHDYLTLERHYLAHLSAPLHSEPTRYAPALHPASDRSQSGTRNEWRVAMVDILGDLQEVAWEPDGTVFRGCCLTPAKERAVLDRLERALEFVKPHAVDYVLLPELTGAPKVLTRLEEFAVTHGDGTLFGRPWVIVGAMHVPVPGHTRLYRNQPHIFTPQGRLGWDYWKSDPVQFSFDGESPGKDSSAALKADEKKPKVYQEEALGRGYPPIVAIDGPMGRLAVIICKDFLLDEVRMRLVELRANVIAVLAMTSPGSVQEFSLLARGFAARSRAVTMFCNTGVHYRGGKSLPALGIIHGNTKSSTKSHALPEGASAVAQVYVLTPSADGLKVDVVQEKPWTWPATR